jgi:hypothetical protein
VKRPVAVAALALLGLVLAAAITLAASSLTSQRIGISDEPLDSGSELARPESRQPRHTPTPAPTATPSPAATEEENDSSGSGGEGEAEDDDSGRGRGRGRGRGGDDDD